MNNLLPLDKFHVYLVMAKDKQRAKLKTFLGANFVTDLDELNFPLAMSYDYKSRE